MADIEVNGNLRTVAQKCCFIIHITRKKFIVEALLHDLPQDLRAFAMVHKALLYASV
jgi:hypothetical protein